MKDFESWHKEKGMMTSIERYDLIPTAETLRKGLEGNTHGNTVGIFYDPIADNESINKEYGEKLKALSENNDLTEEQKSKEYQKLHDEWKTYLKKTSEDLLKEQIKDFLNWLKAEGII